MKKTILKTILAVTVLVSPVFAGNDNNYTYLALGDSVPFGLNPLLLPPYATKLPTPDQFIGYPETVAAAEHLLNSGKEVNASCPGETSGSFLYGVKSMDNGCNSAHQQPTGDIPAFKFSIGLKAPYTNPQMDFAMAQLVNNKHINLVTLSIGANDILLVLPALEKCGTDDQCAGGVLGPVLANYAANLTAILGGIRAHYQGTLVLMTYYSPAPALDRVTIAVNGVMTQVGGAFGAKFADGFTAFQLASAPFNHDACKAGLVIKLPPAPGVPPCDIHPTQLGRDLLAATVEFAIWDRGSQGDNDGKGSKGN